MDKESITTVLLRYIREREGLIKNKQFSEGASAFYAGRGAEIIFLEQSLPLIITDIINFYNGDELDE